MKKFLAVALLAGGLIVTSATAASAHHPIVSGETVCADDGQQTITWTVTNSESATGTNRSMELDQVTIDRGVVGFTVGQLFAPTPATSSSQEATSTYDGDETGDVTLTVRADFKPGENAPQNVLGSATVELVGECVAVTTTSSSTSSTSTSTSTSTTTTTLGELKQTTVEPAVTEQAVVKAEVKGVTLTAPDATPVGGVQTGGGGTSQSTNHLLPLGVALALAGLAGLVTMQLRRRVG
jgi:hypothetical protein